MQLRLKSLLLITPLIVIPMLLIGILTYYELKEINQERILEANETMLEQATLVTNDKINNARANLRLISSNRLVRQYVTTEDEEVRYSVLLVPLLDYFAEIQKAFPDYYEIRFVLPEGYEDAVSITNQTLNVFEDIGSKDYFKVIQDSPSLTQQLVYDENTKQEAILLAIPLKLRDESNKGILGPVLLRGYLTLSFNLDFLDQYLNKLTTATTGFIVITDQNDNVLLHSNTPVTLAEADIPALLKAAPLHSHGHTHDHGGLDHQAIDRIKHLNTKYLAHSHELPGGLIAHTFIPEDIIVSEGWEISKLILLVAIAAIVVSVLLIFFVLRNMLLKPIDQLSEAAKQIGHGDIGHQVSAIGNDEIGSLGHSLNAMSNNLKDSLEKINFLANHDALTNLPNRTMFNRYIDETIANSHLRGHKLALLFFDLDDFKQINDSMGHETGDELLKQLADKLNDCLRHYRKSNANEDRPDAPGDLLARLGGDEFVILLQQITSPMNAVTVAERVLQSIATPILVNGNEMHLGCSIGISIFPEDAENASDLVKKADIAMYHAKDMGKNNYQFFAEEMNRKLVNRLELKNLLKTALTNDQFILHYQPQYDPLNRTIVGVEALVRWQSPDKGIVYPGDFIEVAEESGLITPLTEWVMYQACRQNVEWQKQGMPKIHVSVNVSSLQFKRRDLVSIVKKCLQVTGLEPQYLELELTESALLEDAKDAIKTLSRLDEIGVRVALDDFGTGYSSLSYLEKLPIQVLKVDRSFVMALDDDTKENTVIDAIIALGHALNLIVVAEGVETETQLDYLQAKQCDAIQGYLFSKPVSAEALANLLPVQQSQHKKAF